MSVERALEDRRRGACRARATRRRRRRNAARRKRYVVSMAGGSGTVTAMGDVGREHEVDARSRRGPGRRRRPGTRRAARAAPRASAILRPARSVSARRRPRRAAAGQEREPGHARRARARRASAASAVRRARPARRARPRRPKCAWRFEPAGVGVDEDDALAELREVHGEVDRDEALAHAAAPAADRDEATRASFFARAVRRRGLVRRGTGGQGRR